MKIYDLPRGTGKTTRLIYLSEFNNAPILCTNEFEKTSIILKAEKLNIKIPTPITIDEVIKGLKGKEDNTITNILVDESITILSSLLQKYQLKMIGCTLSSEDY